MSIVNHGQTGLGKVKVNMAASDMPINRRPKLGPSDHFDILSWDLAYDPLDICPIRPDIEHIYMTSFIMQIISNMRYLLTIIDILSACEV